MEQNNNRVCPWWLGYALLIPLRKLGENPKRILNPYIEKGMTILDYGSAMGFFSLPLAKMTGNTGIVYCMDIQKKMLHSLQKRADKAGVGQIIKTRLVGNGFDYSELGGKIDFTMLFAVVHEVPDKKQLFSNLYKMSKPGSKVLFAEPKGHVTPEDYTKSLQLARSAGYKVMDERPMQKGLCAFLLK